MTRSSVWMKTEREKERRWPKTVPISELRALLGDEGEAGFGPPPRQTRDRLRDVKRRYDPTNLFRCNQNIPPA